MLEKALSLPMFPIVPPPSLDRATTERVTQWVTRWHSAEYDVDEISEMLEGWPADAALVDMIEPFGSIPETESVAALAQMVLKLAPLVARGHLQTSHAKGAVRLACRQLCIRGIPFEETAKGDETALWFHFISINEFGDPANLGYATDLSELRLMARQLLEPEELTDRFLCGELPSTFHEASVNVAGLLGDRRLVPDLVRLLHRCEDPQATATVVSALGRLGDPSVVGLIEGYAYSTNVEIATATVLTLEALGGLEAIRILRQVQDIVSDQGDLLAAHVDFALLHLKHGNEELHRQLMAAAADHGLPNSRRLCAVERLSGIARPDIVRLMGRLLDDLSVERVTVDGYLTDDEIYPIREASFMALMDCRISYLVEVLGEDILDRLEEFQTYSMPSWWGSVGADNDLFELEL